jgi:hypothetical protein
LDNPCSNKLKNKNKNKTEKNNLRYRKIQNQQIAALVKVKQQPYMQESEAPTLARVGHSVRVVAVL